MTAEDNPKQSNKNMFSKNDAPDSREPGTAPELGAPAARESDEPGLADKQPAPNEAETDKAVDDIMKSDGDEMLKVQDEAAEAVVPKQGRGAWLKNILRRWWGSPKARWVTIISVVIVLAALFAVPVTRYTILGVVLKADVTVQAVDSKTGAPVSGATVKVGAKTAETNADGKAVLYVHAGSSSIQVSKTYYTSSKQHGLVTIVAKQNNFKLKLVALGRQVKVKLVNKVTGKPLAGASVAVGKSTTKTDSNGTATVVVPSGSTTQEASISLSGYNTAKATITAAGDLTKNTFSLVPAGKLYFLSNLSGKLDVVKTNLDGSGREVVLEGTGNEDKYSTSLLASRDWKYLALLSRRSGDSGAGVYLIDTTNGDKLTTIDEGDATFSLVGWSGDRFIYKVHRNSVGNWQSGQEALKSFDPTTGHTLLLDQTGANGTDANTYAKQSFGQVYLIADRVLYAKNWQGTGHLSDFTSPITGKQPEFDTIGSDGSSHQTLKSFAPADPNGNYYGTSYTVDVRQYDPSRLYMYFYSGSDNNQFYEYENGKVTADHDLTSEKYDQVAYVTYLLSPSGNSTFWGDQRDGKNALFTGNADAQNQKQIAALSDYNVYGWFTDDYLLVSKSSSELYIMPVSGGAPLKITDYYKPGINYNGYGGGYGGL